LTRPAHELSLQPTRELSEQQLGAIRRLLSTAFEAEGGFGETDSTNSLGGVHALLQVDERIVAHASVVPRTLWIAGAPFNTGYVEAVATDPATQGRGYGSRVMEAIAEHIRTSYELGALSTGRAAFYERLGWVRWEGPTFVRTDGGRLRTPDDDGGVFVLVTPPSAAVDRRAPIECEWRPGDVW
jgi:aminoglycoside 2'-N-acetyltransferase I